MLRRVHALWLVSAVLPIPLLLACPTSVGDLCDNRRCDGDGGNMMPVACDITTDTTCVSESLGVFVDVLRGSDSNAGTKAAPVQTIRVGLSNAKAAGKTSVYVCEGTYTENVVVNNAVSIYGGLDCLTWMYVGKEKRPKIVSKSRGGAAVEVRAADQAVNVLDVDVLATDGVDGATDNTINSIGMFVAQAAQVTLRRVSLTAANGGKGADAPAPASNMRGDTASLTGTSPNINSGGPAKTCACGFGASVGGAGGNGGTTPTSGSAGYALLGNDAGVSLGPDGGAGQTVTTPCVNGVDALAGPKPTSTSDGTLGTLSGSGWTPAVGATGRTAESAAGGGGGGGRFSSGAASGGCGACGGAGGAGGHGGGASSALLLADVQITVADAVLVSGMAGPGGRGSNGESGGTGGAGGGGAGFCPGGNGGPSAGGAGGQGGPGGVSGAIVYGARAPQVADENVTLSPGTAGTPGTGGAGGIGGRNDVMNVAPNGPDGPAGAAGVSEKKFQAR